MEMNIIISSDDNYVNPAIVLINSIFANTQNKVNIYYFHKGLKKSNLKKLEKTVTKLGGQFIPVLIDNKNFENAPTISHFTVEMYFRAFAPEYLPIEVERAIYFDPDIIINKNIDDFYSQSFLKNGNEYSLIACEDPGFKCRRELGFIGDKSFNSGVLIMNFNKLRKNYSRNKYFEFINKYNSILLCPDQEMMNVIYAGDVIFDDNKKYNLNIFNLSSTPNKMKMVNEASIIHYSGSRKPWKYNPNPLGKEIYYRFVKQSGVMGWFYFVKVTTMAKCFKKALVNGCKSLWRKRDC